METIENYKFMEKPIFEAFTPDKSKHIKIYESGEFEGFEGFEKDLCIINRTPMLLNYRLSLVRILLSSLCPSEK